MVKFLGILCVSFILTGFTSYEEYQKFSDPVPTTQGQVIYEEMGCVMCHGYQGMADGFLADGLEPKPRDFTSYEEMHRIPYQSMYSAIKHGVPGTGMPSFSLSDEQIDEVIAYIRTFLTENYIVINTCLNTPHVVSLDNVDVSGKFNIEISRENAVKTKIKNGDLIVTPDFVPMMKMFKRKRKRTTRVHVNLTRGEGDDKRYLAIIALRIKDCVK